MVTRGEGVKGLEMNESGTFGAVAALNSAVSVQELTAEKCTQYTRINTKHCGKMMRNPRKRLCDGKVSKEGLCSGFADFKRV